MTPKQQRLNALRYEVSRRVAAVEVAQRALSCELARQALPDDRAIHTHAEFVAEVAALRIEMSNAVAAAIADCRLRYDPDYVADDHHAMLLNFAKAFQPAETNVVSLIGPRRRRRE